MSTKIIAVFFTTASVPRTGLTPTIDITQLDIGSNTVVVNGDSLSEVGNGWYRYNFTTYDVKKSYIFTMMVETLFQLANDIIMAAMIVL